MAKPLDGEVEDTHGGPLWSSTAPCSALWCIDGRDSKSMVATAQEDGLIGNLCVTMYVASEPACSYPDLACMQNRSAVELSRPSYRSRAIIYLEQGHAIKCPMNLPHTSSTPSRLAADQGIYAVGNNAMTKCDNLSSKPSSIGRSGSAQRERASCIGPHTNLGQARHL